MPPVSRQVGVGSTLDRSLTKERRRMKPAEFFESTVAIVHAVILWQILRLLLSQSQEKLQKTLKTKKTKTKKNN